MYSLNIKWSVVVKLYPNAWEIFKFTLAEIFKGATEITLDAETNILYIRYKNNKDKYPLNFTADLGFSVFDKNGVFINVYCSTEGKAWKFILFADNDKKIPEYESTQEYDNRTLANGYGILSAFSYLENHLNKLITTTKVT